MTSLCLPRCGEFWQILVEQLTWFDPRPGVHDICVLALLEQVKCGKLVDICDMLEN